MHFNIRYIGIMEQVLRTMDIAGFSKRLQAVADNIDQNITVLQGHPQLLAQNLLAQMRNLVDIMVSGATGKWLGYKYESIINKAWDKLEPDALFLKEFYLKLQASASHYILEGEASERILVGYLEYLYKARIYARRTWNLSILKELESVPLYDEPMLDYLSNVRKALFLNEGTDSAKKTLYEGLAYLESATFCFVDGSLFYELVITDMIDSAVKANRQIVYSKNKIRCCCGIKVRIRECLVQIGSAAIPVAVLDSWEYAIRPSELQAIGKILGIGETCIIQNEAYHFLMNYMTIKNYSLYDMVMTDSSSFNVVTNGLAVFGDDGISNILQSARSLLSTNNPGRNVVAYLLERPRKRVINDQYCQDENSKLSHLHLQYGCIPFDTMPCYSSLVGHIPHQAVIDKVIPHYWSRSCELLASRVRLNTEVNKQLFTPISDLQCYGDVPELIKEFNDLLYWKHREYSRIILVRTRDDIYACVKGYVDDYLVIEKKLSNLQSAPNQSFHHLVNNSEILLENRELSDEKKEILSKMLIESKVCVIKGEAGSGKTFLLSSVIRMCEQLRCLVLAHTNAAVENLRRACNNANIKFLTIEKYCSSIQYAHYALVVVDECGSIDNKEMRRLLERLKGDYDWLILAGDELQLDPIQFGNWFGLTSRFLKTGISCFSLGNTRRTDDGDLKKLWEEIRSWGERKNKGSHTDGKEVIQEYIERMGYSSTLDDSLYSDLSDDTIILCPSYGGPYGINAINRAVQASRGNKAVTWQTKQYCVGDPILFSNVTMFKGLLFNNEKGVILNAEVDPEKVKITITAAIEYPISQNEANMCGAPIQVLDSRYNNMTVIRFTLFKRVIDTLDADDDNDDRYAMPFQVAYATSIHKAQGLQYDNVRIIISAYDKRSLTPNLFYTAITRAKRTLHIYWPQDIEHDFLSSLNFVSTDNETYHLLQEIKHHPDSAIVLDPQKESDASNQANSK